MQQKQCQYARLAASTAHAARRQGSALRWAHALEACAEVDSNILAACADVLARPVLPTTDGLTSKSPSTDRTQCSANFCTSPVSGLCCQVDVSWVDFWRRLPHIGRRRRAPNDAEPRPGRLHRSRGTPCWILFAANDACVWMDLKALELVHGYVST